MFPLLPTPLIVFSILFLCFITQVKPRLDTSQVAPPPHQTAGNVRNGNPLISVSSRAQMGGYRKILTVDPTEANTGIFHPSFFILLFPTSMPLTFSLPIPHGSERLHTAPPPPPAPTPTRARHWDAKHMVWLGLWYGSGYPGGGVRVL